MKTTKSMLDYLATCSQTSLEAFELARLNDLANIRKQMMEVVNDWVESDIQARIAEWILVRRRQQATLRAATQSFRRMRSKQASLPLFPAANDSLAKFPTLAPNAIFPVLRDAVSDEPVRALRRGSEALAKSKRIA
ncbi:MAG TPA: hypothetical protein VMV59_03255 [Candidatus Dormibacteraeota bacterium]|nr:hypothetical protein [Candidatus Dormibacteraeota bacterium]